MKRAFVWFLFAIAVLMIARHAHAHDWYPWECCSSKDCWPAPGKEPMPRHVGTKYILFDGTEIDEKDAKQSPDEDFHVCRQGGNLKAPVIFTNGKPCFWAPVSGV